MLNPLLSTDQQNIVVFWIWKSLEYWKRMLLGIGCILFGFLIQYFFTSLFWLGLPFLLAGSLFFIVRGYDNTTDFGTFTPTAEWEKVDEDKLLEAEQLARQMRKWDRSFIDISNGLGVFTFIIVFIIGLGLYIYGTSERNYGMIALAFDTAVLFIPLWFTGKRDIMTQPNLLLKIKVFKRLLDDVQEETQPHDVEYFMLLKGKDEQTKVPSDVKLRVKVKDEDPDFLGFYAQIVINSVSGKKYPYCYVVLVAKQGYGLKKAYKRYTPPDTGFLSFFHTEFLKEFKEEDDVEVFVLRQKTTKTSGYHTKDHDMKNIFLAGLHLTEQVAVKNATDTA